ncbi:MAG TPA: 2-phosphosulfolactate phosphatase [archaeon]|nr:2-phosphosulfolactate phosphatase [archaeon]
MKVEIKSCLEGAKSAEGIAVIIDVINASSTIVECFEKGAKEVVPVDSLKKALKIKKQGDLICGEVKHFRKVDFYNSPHYVNADVKDKRIIIKTDAGTKGILGAKKAKEVLIGCFLNAPSVCDYLKQKNTEKVALVPMGDYGKRKNVEDETCAIYLKTLLENKKPENFEIAKNKINRGSFRNIFRSIFFRKQIEKSLRLDTSKKVPKFVNGRLVA